MKHSYSFNTLLSIACFFCLFICPSSLKPDVAQHHLFLSDSDSLLASLQGNLKDSFNFEEESFVDLVREFSNKPSIGFSNLGESRYQGVLDNGEATLQIFNTFRPAQGQNIDQYSFRFVCDKEEIINDTDVTIESVEETIDNIQVMNFTYDINMNKFPGTTNCRSIAIRDGSIEFQSPSYIIIVSGLVLFTTGTQHILGGRFGAPIIQTYQEALNNPNNVIQNISAIAGWPDGCTTLVGSCFSRHQTDLDNMVISLIGHRTIYLGADIWNSEFDNSTGCGPMDGTVSNGIVLLPANCAAAFARTSNPAGLRFGVRIRDYKVGDSTIDFDLPLGDGTFAGNDVDVNITSSGGQRPPAVVQEILPRKVFRRAGGETLTLDGYNLDGATTCDFSLISVNGNKLHFPSAIDPPVISLPNDTHRCIFTTAPGNGVNLTWNLDVKVAQASIGYVSLVNPPFLFSYALTPRFDTVSPLIFSEGEVVTLIGLFQTFNPNYTTDGIILGGEFISGITYDSISETRIVFRAPPQPIPDVYKYLLQVSVGGRSTPSNSIEIQYLAPPIVTGFTTQGPVTETPENKTFYITDNNNNNNIFSPILSGNLDGGTYRWQLFTPTGGAFQPVFTLSYNIIGAFIAEYNVPYRLLFNITNSQNLQHSFQASVVKLRGQDNNVIVTIQTPTKRTRSVPSSPLLVTIGLALENINYVNPVFEYTWNWRGVNYSLGASDPTVPAPVLSGRTFRIPNCDMMYGNYNLTLYASVRDGLNTDSVQTSASVVVSIDKTPLVGKINGGIIREAVPIVSPKNITAASSYDPDVLTNCPSYQIGCPTGLTGLACQRAKLLYNWTQCIRSRDSEFSTSEPCPEFALDERSAMQFVLSTVELNELVYRIPGTNIRQRTYVRYTLDITTSRADFEIDGQTDTRKTTVQYVMNLEQDQTQRVASPGGINFANQYGSRVNPRTIRPWEDFIVGVLYPNDITDRVQWGYRIQLPIADETLLDNPANLLQGDSYWQPDGPTNQAKNLGIKKSNNTNTVLSAGQSYVLTISDYIFPTSNFNPNEIQISFATLRYPTLQFPDLVITSGGVNVNFAAYARSSEDLAEIMFYFYLVDKDNGRNVLDICLGPCGGESGVGFLLLLPGIYQIRAEMYDSTGDVLFGSQVNAQTITVTNTNTPIQNQQLWISRYQFCSAAGDMGCTRYLDSIYDHVFTAQTRSILDSTVDRNVNMSSVFTSPEKLTIRQSEVNIVETILANLNRQLTNSENALNSAAFAQNLRSMLVITNELNNGLYTVEHLLQTLHVFTQNALNQIQNVESGRVQQNIVSSMESVTTLLGRLLGISLRLDGGGLSRRRLLQTTTDNNYLDVQVVIRDYAGGLAAQSLACGSPAVTYEIQNDVGQELSEPIFVTSGKVCNQLDKSAVLPLIGTQAEVTDVCSQNFVAGSSNFDPRIVYLIQSDNYPAKNGFKNSINTVSIGNVGFYEFGGYQFEASSGLPFSGDRCYNMLFAYSRNLSIIPGATVRATQLKNQKKFRSDACNDENPCYEPDENGIIASLDAAAATVRVFADDIGLYGGILSLVQTPSPEVIDTPEPTVDRGDAGLSGGAIAGIVIGALLGIILACILIWLIAMRCCGVAGANRFDYVERDIYGRGFVMDDDLDFR